MAKKSAVSTALRIARRTRKADGGNVDWGRGLQRWWYGDQPRGPDAQGNLPEVSMTADPVSRSIEGMASIPRRLTEAAQEDTRHFAEPGYRSQAAAPAFEAAMALAGQAPFARPGTAGIFGGRLARTADHDAMRSAEAMEKAGATPAEIWDKTGTARGKDPAWRQEIDDSRSYINDKFLSTDGKVIIPPDTPLPDMLRHPNLYDAYPQLNDVRLHPLAPQADSATGGHQMGQNIHLSSGRYDPDQARAALLHEAQHSIQDVENFARGDNPDTYTRWGRHGDPISEADAIKRYEASAGENEAYNTQDRMNLGVDQRRSLLPELTERVPRDQQHIVQGSSLSFAPLARFEENSMVPHKNGGAAKKALRIAKADGGPVHEGYIPGDTGGRTDNKDISVGSGAYVIPADILSGLGEGNSQAGWAALSREYGLDQPRKAAGGPISGAPMGAPPMGTDAVPIVAASGEAVIPPDAIIAKHGDLDTGHKVLDAVVKHVRAKTVKKLKSLPGPKKN